MDYGVKSDASVRSEPVLTEGLVGGVPSLYGADDTITYAIERG